MSSTGFAAAQAYEAERPARWSTILGGGAMFAPEYEGSDEMDTTGVPFVSFGYGRFNIGPDALSARLGTFGNFNIVASLGYDGGRKVKDIDSGYLDGMGDIDGGATLGARLGYDFGDAEAFIDVDKYLKGSEGTKAKFGFAYERPVSDNWSLSAELSATVADSKYMQSYFGVTEAQSLSSGYIPYEAESGLQRIDINFGATYRVTDSWFIRGEAGMGQLQGDAKNSPIVYDKAMPQALLFVGYNF